jgi:hypothetical protein
MSRRLEIQIDSFKIESDTEVQKSEVRSQYLRGHYTELREVSTDEKIQRVVAVEMEQEPVEVTVVEWKPSHIPPTKLLSEYFETGKEIAIEQEYSTVTPHLLKKKNRLEDIILDRLQNPPKDI